MPCEVVADDLFGEGKARAKLFGKLPDFATAVTQGFSEAFRGNKAGYRPFLGALFSAFAGGFADSVKGIGMAMPDLVGKAFRFLTACGNLFCVNTDVIFAVYEGGAGYGLRQTEGADLNTACLGLRVQSFKSCQCDH